MDALRLLVFFVFCPFAAVLSSVSQAQAKTPSTSQATPIVVSIAPQKYILERLAGDAVAVTVLVRPGADPHAYEPSPQQMRAAAQARAWFTIGVPFEDAWIPRIRAAAATLEIVSCINGIKRLPVQHEHSAAEQHDGHGHASHHGAGLENEDPHVWLSPTLIRAMLPRFCQQLERILGDEHRTALRSATEALDLELAVLDKELKQRFEKIPAERRVFFTFHPSWRYFAHDYDLMEFSIETDGKEPGPKSMRRVIDAARRYGLTTIFSEPQFPKAAVEAVAANIGARIVLVNPLAENLPALYKDMADKLILSFSR